MSTVFSGYGFLRKKIKSPTQLQSKKTYSKSSLKSIHRRQQQAEISFLAYQLNDISLASNNNSKPAAVAQSSKGALKAFPFDSDQPQFDNDNKLNKKCCVVIERNNKLEEKKIAYFNNLLHLQREKRKEAFEKRQRNDEERQRLLREKEVEAKKIQDQIKELRRQKEEKARFKAQRQLIIEQEKQAGKLRDLFRKEKYRRFELLKRTKFLQKKDNELFQLQNKLFTSTQAPSSEQVMDSVSKTVLSNMPIAVESNRPTTAEEVNNSASTTFLSNALSSMPIITDNAALNMAESNKAPTADEVINSDSTTQLSNIPSSMPINTDNDVLNTVEPNRPTSAEEVLNSASTDDASISPNGTPNASNDVITSVSTAVLPTSPNTACAANEVMQFFSITVLPTSSNAPISVNPLRTSTNSPTPTSNLLTCVSTAILPTLPNTPAVTDENIIAFPTTNNTSLRRRSESMDERFLTFNLKEFVRHELVNREGNFSDSEEVCKKISKKSSQKMIGRLTRCATNNSTAILDFEEGMTNPLTSETKSVKVRLKRVGSNKNINEEDVEKLREHIPQKEGIKMDSKMRKRMLKAKNRLRAQLEKIANIQKETTKIENTKSLLNLREQKLHLTKKSKTELPKGNILKKPKIIIIQSSENVNILNELNSPFNNVMAPSKELYPRYSNFETENINRDSFSAAEVASSSLALLANTAATAPIAEMNNTNYAAYLSTKATNIQQQPLTVEANISNTLHPPNMVMAEEEKNNLPPTETLPTLCPTPEIYNIIRTDENIRKDTNLRLLNFEATSTVPTYLFNGESRDVPTPTLPSLALSNIIGPAVAVTQCAEISKPAHLSSIPANANNLPSLFTSDHEVSSTQETFCESAKRNTIQLQTPMIPLLCVEATNAIPTASLDPTADSALVQNNQVDTTHHLTVENNFHMRRRTRKLSTIDDSTRNGKQHQSPIALKRRKTICANTSFHQQTLEVEVNFSENATTPSTTTNPIEKPPPRRRGKPPKASKRRGRPAKTLASPPLNLTKDTAQFNNLIETEIKETSEPLNATINPTEKLVPVLNKNKLSKKSMKPVAAPNTEARNLVNAEFKLQPVAKKNKTSGSIKEVCATNSEGTNLVGTENKLQPAIKKNKSSTSTREIIPTNPETTNLVNTEFKNKESTLKSNFVQPKDVKCLEEKVQPDGGMKKKISAASKNKQKKITFLDETAPVTKEKVKSLVKSFKGAKMKILPRTIRSVVKPAPPPTIIMPKDQNAASLINLANLPIGRRSRR